MTEQARQPQAVQQPRNIFEVINQNIVDMSQDMVAMYQKVDLIFNALYPSIQNAEPDVPGAAQEEKKQ